MLITGPWTGEKMCELSCEAGGQREDWGKGSGERVLFDELYTVLGSGVK